MVIDTPYAPVWQMSGADRQTVVDVLSEAFVSDPVACWVFPDSYDRRRLQPRFYRSQLAHPAAEVYLADDGGGAAVWQTFVLGRTPDEGVPDALADDLSTGFGASGWRLRALSEALSLRRPDREPHLYLSWLGVLSGRQGVGLGSAMLRHRLEQADADGLPGYLEASSPRSRALYRRHGFQDFGEPVRVADSPPLWPMWRQARR